MLQFIKSTIAFIGAIFFSAVNKLFCSPCVQKYVAYFWLGFFTVRIQSYETPVANLMKAIAAVIVLVGAFNVYFKMQNGDQDVKKTVMMTIGGCVAFIAMSEALPMFFK